MPEHRERQSVERLTESDETPLEGEQPEAQFEVRAERRPADTPEEREQHAERVREARARARRLGVGGHPRYGDWSYDEVSDDKIELTPTEQKECADKTDAFFAEVKDSKLATTVGYKVAGAYDVRVQGWTTRTKIVEVEGKRLFVLYSFPAANTRRRWDRLMEIVAGDPMRKPTPEGWKATVEARSEIPTVSGTREDMVVMAYLEAFNAYDLFAHQKDVRDFGPFDWAKEATPGDKLALVAKIGGALKELHDNGKTWGEAILPNVVLTKDALTKDVYPVFVDPETTYEGIPELEQRARDVRTLITSISGALARGEGQRNFQDVANLVIEGYGDEPELLEALDALCADPLTWRQKLNFEFWGKFRIGATDGKEFKEVCAAIRAAIAERRQSS